MPAPSHSPFSGCLIGIIAIAIVVVTICVGIWNLGKLDTAMQGFAEDKPRTLTTTTLQGAELETVIAPLQAQLDALAAIKPDSEQPDATATLTITTYQAQALMGSLPINTEIAKVFSLTAIRDGYLEIEVSIPIRNKPFSEEKFRYVNGIMLAELNVGKLQPTLKATSIKTAQGEVDPGFLQHFQFYEFAKHLTQDDKLNTILPNITTIQINEGSIDFSINILEYHKLKAQLQPDAIQPVNTNSQRWVGLGFLIMVLFGFFYMRNIGKAKNPLN